MNRSIRHLLVKISKLDLRIDFLSRVTTFNRWKCGKDNDNVINYNDN